MKRSKKQQQQAKTKAAAVIEEDTPMFNTPAPVAEANPVTKHEETAVEPEKVVEQSSDDKPIQDMFETGRTMSPIFKISIIAGICLLAFFIRIFSVIRYESVIHEFDPWFNFRTTKFLTKEGWYALWNWYDSESWYPLGRVIGGTIFPGIMGTAASFKWLTDALCMPMDIRNICVFLAPVFSGFCSISTYLFTKEATNRPEAGLFAALFIGIVPSYISRSVAGSYDNEGVAIWALVNTFYLWIKAVNTGSIMWSTLCTLQYFYMVAAWGGYSFIINIIPIFVLCIIFANKFNMKIYIAYSVFYVLGTVLAMTIPFVTFNAIKSSEHLASHCVFFGMQAYVAVEFVRKNLPEAQFRGLLRIGIALSMLTFAFVFFYLTLSGNTKWSGRSMTLLDPTYAKKYIPIIASVSEHQPTAWSNYFFDLGYIVLLMPAGYYFLLVEDVTHGKIFLAIYGVLATYFSCVMIRLMLTLAPAVCIIAGVALSELFRRAGTSIRESMLELDEEEEESSATQEAEEAKAASAIEQQASKKQKQVAKQQLDAAKEQRIAKKNKRERRIPLDMSMAMICFTLIMMFNQIYHSTLLAADAYSSPSIIMSHGRGEGRIIVDDYREAYYWLKQNTAQDARILSWWDYGYQITGMANRTVLVDNNTWNNTHIATVGKALASTEKEGYNIARFMGADYVLVIFGGMTNFSGDDISKFMWMIRIAAAEFPQIKEDRFYNKQGAYRVDSTGAETLRNCLMYKLVYYRFGEVKIKRDEEAGYDSVRKAVIGNKDFKLDYFEEAFTSERWLVRIYRVKKPSAMDPPMKPRGSILAYDKTVTENLMKLPNF